MTPHPPTLFVQVFIMHDLALTVFARAIAKWAALNFERKQIPLSSAGKRTRS